MILVHMVHVHISEMPYDDYRDAKNRMMSTGFFHEEVNIYGIDGTEV